MVALQTLLETIRRQGDNPRLPTPAAWNRQFSLFPYQRVGVSHLLPMTRFILGDPTGTGKTVHVLYTWGVLRDQKKHRLIVVSTKSAIYQWVEETQRFLPGVGCWGTGDRDQRRRCQVYDDWIAAGPSTALVLGWGQLARDWEVLYRLLDTVGAETYLCLDEIQKARSPKAQIYKIVGGMVDRVIRVHGLTATLVKNRVHDAWSILNLLVPGFMTKSYFEQHYCLFDRVRVPVRTGAGGGRRLVWVRRAAGYRQLDRFTAEMQHLYLARTDQELALQRPAVVQITRKIELGHKHRKIYREVERGLFVVAATDAAAATAALGQAQIAVNTPEHFSDNVNDRTEYQETQRHNDKLNLLKDLLENELYGEPIILYSSSATTITVLQQALDSYKPAVIKGDMNSGDRQTEQFRFQAGETSLILITDAGGESLNLQRAKHVIFYSRPWDPGRYVQVVGRARRFGSDHATVTLWHLTALDTIDELVDALLLSKVPSFEAIVKNGSGVSLDQSSSLPLELARRLRRQRLQD